MERQTTGAWRSNENPMFRSQFSETIFQTKYAHEGCETWSKLAHTLVEDVCRDLLPPDIKSSMVEMIADMKFIPGGRYLYYAGRPNSYWNNCGAYETKLLTDRGFVRMGDYAGQTVNVFSPVDGTYRPATVYNHGKQRLYRIRFRPIRGADDAEYVVRFTRDHRWILKDGSETTLLQVGDRVPAIDHDGFEVVSITPDVVEDVFCPFEPVNHQIVIDYNIQTGNCFLLKAEEDTREDWANLSWKSESCLMTGGGIGVDYSVYRPKGRRLSKTGGESSGPVPKMQMINEIGRKVMQGGSRRSAIYASLNWQHADVWDFLVAKDWHNMRVPGTNVTLWDVKQNDFNFPAPLDMTNISVNYDTEWLLDFWDSGELSPVFVENVQQALRTAEPGFSFNFFGQENETLRNACTEVTSEDDSDVCNLGSINMGRIESLDDMHNVVQLATMFLICGTMHAKLPYQRVYDIREKNRRLGLGLMGLHEWLIKNGMPYEVTPELHRYLTIYQRQSDKTADEFADYLGVSRPVAKRAIAPTGTIGILAGTTTGIEPLFAVAYKRRYLKNGTEWHYQYVVDGSAQELIDLYGADPDKMEGAVDMAADYERRIKFQADVQDYVDQSISSTINLPAWGTEHNNEDTVQPFAETLAKYAHRLRGFTCYPDGARGGQPLTPVSYHEAVANLGKEFREDVVHTDVCDLRGGGVCGI